MRKALGLAEQGMVNNHGGPFGCVVVKNGKVIGEGFNKVISSNDPTAHAEITAIRNACNTLKSFQLTGCEIYTTCEPCPMCLGAIYWARPGKIYFAANRKDAASAGFDDEFIYEELNMEPGQRSIPMIQVEKAEIVDLFKRWEKKPDKMEY